MAENIPKTGSEQEGGNVGREAVWQAGPGDVPMPVRIAEEIVTHSGKKFVRLEGSGTLIPASEIQEVKHGEASQELKVAEEAGEVATEQVVGTPEGIGESQQEGRSETGASQAESVEIQLARQKVNELLNDRQAKAVSAKEAKKKGNHDAKIALYEALREVVQKGDFDSIVSVKNSSGGDVSPRAFVSEMYKQAKKQTDELIEAVDVQHREDLRPQLEKAYVLFDLAEDALNALEKVEAQHISPSESEQTDEPNQRTELTEQQPKSSAEKDNRKYKFEKGEIVKVRTRDGRREFDWKVNRSFTGRGSKVYVRLIDPRGKLPERVVPQDQLLEWNPRADEPAGAAPEQSVKNEDAPRDENEKENEDSKNVSQEDVPGNGNDNGGDDQEVVSEDEDSPWLDPRRIQELKARYDELIRIKQAETGGHVSQEFRDIALTHVIETAVRKAIEHAEFVAEKYNVGKTPTIPSEVIKQRMAEMMDMPEAQLSELALEADQLVSERQTRFKTGQEVKIVTGIGEIQEGWKVKGYRRHHGTGDPEVIVSNGREKRYYAPDRLRQFQEQADPDQDKNNLEKLKPYFDGPAKVRTGDGIIDGQFQGYKVSNGNVYFGDSSGKRVGEVPVDEFLGWQNERLTVEVEAEQAAEKLTELERKVADYIGKRVKVRGESGTWLPGFTCLEYDSDKQEVKIADQQGNTYERPLEMFVEWQETPGGEDTIKDPQPKGEAGTDDEAETEEDEEKGGAKTKVEVGPPPKIDAQAEAEAAAAAKAAAEEEAKKKIPLSWWEQTVKRWDRLPNNAAKVSAAGGGLILGTTVVGLPALAALGIQHKWHHWKLKKEKQKNKLG